MSIDEIDYFYQKLVDFIDILFPPILHFYFIFMKEANAFGIDSSWAQ